MLESQSRVLKLWIFAWFLKKTWAKKWFIGLAPRTP